MMTLYDLNYNKLQKQTVGSYVMPTDLRADAEAAWPYRKSISSTRVTHIVTSLILYSNCRNVHVCRIWILPFPVLLSSSASSPTICEHLYNKKCIFPSPRPPPQLLPLFVLTDLDISHMLHSDWHMLTTCRQPTDNTVLVSVDIQKQTAFKHSGFGLPLIMLQCIIDFQLALLFAIMGRSSDL